MRHIIRNALAVALMTTALAQGQAAAQNPTLTYPQCDVYSGAMLANGRTALDQADARIRQLQPQLAGACASTSTAEACAALELPLGLAQAEAAAGAGSIKMADMVMALCPEIIAYQERQAKTCAADLALYQAEQKLADAYAAMAAASILNLGGATSAGTGAAAAKRQMSQTRADMVALSCPNTP